jgi:hypothetical protein
LGRLSGQIPGKFRANSGPVPGKFRAGYPVQLGSCMNQPFCF